MTRTCTCVAAALSVVLLGAGVAGAQVGNYRPYVVGGRAAGMGGAFTALADDGSGPYYNPGGIAFARRSSLSLSASVYGVVTGSTQDALGDGHAFTFTDVQAFPVSTAAVFKWGGTDTPDGSAANAIALTAFVPDAILLDDRDTLGSTQNAFFLSTQNQTVWGGITYARRIGNLGIGVGTHLLIQSASSHLDLSAINATDSSRFVTITSRIDNSVVGVVGAIGFRLDATEHLRLGLSFFSPELGLKTERRGFVRLTEGVIPPATMPQALVRNEDNLTASPTLPIRVQGGFAWTDGAFTFAADAIFLAPVDVHDNPEKADVGFDRHVVLNPVVNGSVGMEYVASSRFPIRAGFFTDLSSAPDPVAKPPTIMMDPNVSNTQHLDRVGGSFSVGVKTDHTATDFGTMISYGFGKDLVPNNLDFSDLKPADETHIAAYVFLASSYEF